MTLTNQPNSILPSRHPAPTDLVRVLLVVEGTNDIEFLRRISRLLHTHDASLPHLADMEERGELVFVPFGGGHVQAWSHRLAALNKSEFHIYDRELPPETALRREAAEAVNGRPDCYAVVTRKRSLENYLHPAAILVAGNIEAVIDDFGPAAESVAKRLYQVGVDKIPWELLSRRARCRMANRAKRWLNTMAADHMTVELLRQRDHEGEVISWLQAINQLAETR